jgi:hypothetical protein
MDDAKITQGKQEDFDPLYLPARNVSHEQKESLLELCVKCFDKPAPDGTPVTIFGFNSGDAKAFLQLAKEVGVKMLLPPQGTQGTQYVRFERNPK